MAKRKTIGSVIKGQNGKPDYIKISNDVVLSKGQYVNLESKAGKIKGIKEAVDAGKLSPDTGAKMLESAEKIPEFVRFEMYVLEK
jgi:hypothetical protein